MYNASIIAYFFTFRITLLHNKQEHSGFGTSAKLAYAPETQECREQLGATGIKTLLQELARSQAGSGLGAPGALGALGAQEHVL